MSLIEGDSGLIESLHEAAQIQIKIKPSKKLDQPNGISKPKRSRKGEGKGAAGKARTKKNAGMQAVSGVIASSSVAPA